MISTDKNLPLINSSYTIFLNAEPSAADRLASSVWQRKSSALRLLSCFHAWLIGLSSVQRAASSVAMQ